jgi:hypothetical protein
MLKDDRCAGGTNVSIPLYISLGKKRSLSIDYHTKIILIEQMENSAI